MSDQTIAATQWVRPIDVTTPLSKWAAINQQNAQTAQTQAQTVGLNQQNAFTGQINQAKLNLYKNLGAGQSNLGLSSAPPPSGGSLGGSLPSASPSGGLSMAPTDNQSSSAGPASSPSAQSGLSGLGSNPDIPPALAHLPTFDQISQISALDPTQGKALAETTEKAYSWRNQQLLQSASSATDTASWNAALDNELRRGLITPQAYQQNYGKFELQGQVVKSLAGANEQLGYQKDLINQKLMQGPDGSVVSDPNLVAASAATAGADAQAKVGPDTQTHAINANTDLSKDRLSPFQNTTAGRTLPGGNVPVPGASGQPQRAIDAAMPPTSVSGMQYAANMSPTESSGNPNAQSTTSTSSGTQGFTNPTWKQVAPAVAQATGLPVSQVLAQKNDPNLAAHGTVAYAQQNAPVLQQAGLPVNQLTLALAHKLGPQGAINIANAPANTPLTDDLLGQKGAIAANPTYGKMTAGQFIRNTAQNFPPVPVDFGGSNPAPAAPSLMSSAQAATVPSAGTPSTITAQNPDGSTTIRANPQVQAQADMQTTAAKGAGDYIAAIPNQLTALTDNANRIAVLKNDIEQNGSNPGIFASGAGFDLRNNAAKTANSLADSLGLPAPFDKKAIGDNEAFAKASSVAAFDFANTMSGGKLPLGELLQANKSVANPQNTLYGNTVVANLADQENQRKTDRLQYQNSQFNAGVNPVDSGAAFDQAHPPQSYVASALAQTVQARMPNYVGALKLHAGNPAAITAFDKKFGAGTAELILKGGSQ